ncbi:MAG: hypothetical protein ACRDSJ_03155 [Rubrobacteraceae bacterium]
MTDAQLYSTWIIGLVIGAVVVLLAAALLIAIIVVARRILTHAGQALEAAESIARDTEIIWALDETNEVAADILATAESIEERGANIAGALHGERVSGGGGA